jgi:hypothetical protein
MLNGRLIPGGWASLRQVGVISIAFVCLQVTISLIFRLSEPWDILKSRTYENFGHLHRG